MKPYPRVISTLLPSTPDGEDRIKRMLLQYEILGAPWIQRLLGAWFVRLFAPYKEWKVSRRLARLRRYDQAVKRHESTTRT